MNFFLFFALLMAMMAQATPITDYVNTYRALHSAPPVIISDAINSRAQTWATELAYSGNFRHSSGSGYGENLAYFGGRSGSDEFFVKMAVDAWYNEISDYDFNKPGFSGTTGHFTQLVWVNCDAIGYAVSRNGSSVYVVMQYSPPGNYLGMFTDNVKPLNTIMPSPFARPPPFPIQLPLPITDVSQSPSPPPRSPPPSPRPSPRSPPPSPRSPPKSPPPSPRSPPIKLPRFPMPSRITIPSPPHSPSSPIKLPQFHMPSPVEIPSPPPSPITLPRFPMPSIPYHMTLPRFPMPSQNEKLPKVVPIILGTSLTFQVSSFILGGLLLVALLL